MNVLYEEDGGFKVGSILADNTTSLQVEAPHGKRSKVKSSSVLFRFEEPLSGFMERAQQNAEQIDLDFLWECSPQEEFAYETLARDYFGHPPSASEAAALLLRMHGAPMYFYKKGKGRYRPAAPDALKAAIASIERKHQQALLQADYVAQLTRFELPDNYRSQLPELLYRPDRNTVEVKALEEAASAVKLTPLRLLERCGAIPSTSAYHVDRFLFHHFPRGLGSAEADDVIPESLDLASVHAFSIDDSTTTEIDDALSLTPLSGGGWSIGIHIAAPALGIAVGSALDRQAATRLSTIYMPGGKITMLPAEVAARYSLSEASDRPVLSLYADVSPEYVVRSTRTEIERVHIDANLRHDALEDAFNEEALCADTLPAVPFASELKRLWEFATVLEAGRGRSEGARALQMDYNFYVENDRVRIIERRRGSPVDKLVSELMILVNTHWGRALAEANVPAIFRAQGNGKVRMSTVAAAHQGLGVAQYVWSSSPLRRYVDLVNQRQLIAWHRGEPPPYAAGSQALLSALHDFEQAYETYAEFQRSMERYWCLRWLIQEERLQTTAEVYRENLVKITGIPLIARVASLPALPPGAKVALKISDIDFLELTFHAEYCGSA
jgi:exoribonuclease-2